MRLETELSKIESLIKIEELKTEIDKLRPLSSEIEDRIFRKFRLDWNYHSNAIEGNTLNYGETYAFLMHGVTAKGKPLKDYLDIKGHNSAINFLLNFIHDKEELTEAAIRELHKTILTEPYDVDAMTSNGKKTKKRIELGVYKRTPNHVLTSTGEMHYFASPEETPAKMNDLMKWFREVRTDKDVHPVVIAALFHHKFASIHPFDDGNGRIARLLMNLILMQYHLPPAIIKKEDRGNYYLALSQADIGIYQPFVEYISESVVHSQEIYLKGAKGESIEEADDIDKEIILLKKELENRKGKVEKKFSQIIIQEVIELSFYPLLERIIKIATPLKELFFNCELKFHVLFTDASHIDIPNVKEISIEKIRQLIPMNGISHLICNFFLNEFKSKTNCFSLGLWIDIEFNEYYYMISCGLFKESNFLTFPEQKSNKIWQRQYDYEDKTELDEKDLFDAHNIIGKRYIELIKEHSNK